MAPVMEPGGYFKVELGGLIWFILILFSRAQSMGQENDGDHIHACQVPCPGHFISLLNVFPTAAD